SSCGIARMLGGPAIQCRATRSSPVLCNVWCNPQPTTSLHKTLCVIAFVSCDRFTALAGETGQHLASCFTLAISISLTDLRIYHQTMTIVHQDAAQISQLGFGLMCFFVAACFRSVVDV